MRIVITGVKGYVGSVTAKIATEHGHQVIGLDNESRGLNEVRFLDNGYRKHDCMGGIGEALLPFKEFEKIDAVIHLAAATGSLERPLDELRAFNVEMMQHVYQDAVRLGAKVFLWPTTSLALGVPDSPYVMSKEEGLKRLQALDVNTGIAVPVRFFNVTGAYDDLSEKRRNEVHMIPTMVDCFLQKKPFVVNGNDYAETVDGSPSRDFTNCIDVAEYLVWLAEQKIEGRRLWPSAADGCMWLGTGQSTTVLQAIKLFERFVGPLKYEIGPRRPYDCGSLQVDRVQSMRFAEARGGLLVPPWVSIRDELAELLFWRAGDEEVMFDVSDDE